MRFEPVAQRSQPATTPSSVKGINAFDSLVAMGPGFAITLRNMFAQPYGCQIRKGFVQHQTSLDGPVETIAAHNCSSSRLYAFVDQTTAAELYDITTPNQAAPVALIDDLTNARWQHINFPNVAGVHLVMVNGADDLIWIKPDHTIIEVSSGAGTGNTIGGIDPKKLIDVYSHQKRLWFVEKDSTAAWYLPPEQITGVAVYFDPGANWTRGGQLSQIISWTIDDGTGMDDKLAFISTQGEVSIYSGTDPSSINTWSLQGVYYAGAPVGRRTACRLDGDVIMITSRGPLLLSQLLYGSESNQGSLKYVEQPVSNAVAEYGDMFGWQPFVFSRANMMLINVPNGNNTAFQFVLNTTTQAWSIFIGYNALCWELFNDGPFFGGLGAVYRAWEGFTDDQYYDENGDIQAGVEVYAEAQTSFDYFGNFGTQKHVKMVRPTIISKGQFSINLAVNTDFSFSGSTAPVSFHANSIGTWDDGLWDSVVWDGGLETYKSWVSAVGIGTAFSLRLLIKANSETYWAATDWLIENGGIL